MAPSSLNIGRCFLLCLSVSLATSDDDHSSFHECLCLHTSPSTNVSNILYTPDTNSYSSLLKSAVVNLRFAASETPKPLFIVTPTDESHVQATVFCCRSHNLQIRVRSGGHDNEGLSYRSDQPSRFVMVYLENLRSVSVNLEQSEAWVQAGATLGELYYRIAEKSGSYGFSGGTCHTVGVGGLISGGGVGTLMRKYGLAVDNVLDAKLVDAEGRLLDRKAMGEDLFWAIRGGGGASFGIIVGWKLRLVPVPPVVSVFTVDKTREEGALKLVNKWQNIAYKLHEDIYLKIFVQAERGAVRTSFRALFLGVCSEMLKMMDENFPELGMERSDCKDMSWIQSVVYFDGYTNGEPAEILMDRGAWVKVFSKNKSDYMMDPIPEFMWEKILRRVEEADGVGQFITETFGGRMNEISESATPFPRRNGTMYSIQYYVAWKEGGVEASKKHLSWIRSFYKEMAPYVSKHPRAAYLNFRDLDLGMNREGNRTSYSDAKIWGKKYFQNNFKRLARVKGVVDPENFFWNEQSIPPLPKERLFKPHAIE